MSTDMTIFQDPGDLVVIGEPTALAEKVRPDFESKRIRASANGTFRRIVNGEQLGKPVKTAMDVILINFLSDISRQFYAKAYDKNDDPTLPDCWSHDGKVPYENAPNIQSESCKACDQNIAGSGQGNSKKCRFLRRTAILLAGDPVPGSVYQLSIPATSLFGDKVPGNTQAFEQYLKLLTANNASPDRVVTRVTLDEESEFVMMNFTPIRPITQAELELVVAAQATPDSENYLVLTAAAADGVTKKPDAEDEDDDAPTAAEIAQNKKDVAAAKRALKAAAEDDEPEPIKRPSKAKKEVEAKESLAATVSQWED